MSPATDLAPLLERFFTRRLMQERRVSPHTIGSYRDTFRLFLRFVQEHLHKAPCQLLFEDIDAPLVTTFLDHLEKQRGLTVRSRNLRLTAIHSFFGTWHTSCRLTRPRSSASSPFPVNDSLERWSAS